MNADRQLPALTARTPRIELAIVAALAIAGIFLGWNKGQLPQREPPQAHPAQSASKAKSETAPDLQLYDEMIVEVRSGRDYYDAARDRIPSHGFPISSPLNWRLPTYAWLLSLLPNKCWIQATLTLLSLGALGIAFAGECRMSSVGHAAVTTFLLFGVMRWSFDGEAYLAQEPWAATLMVISLAAFRLKLPWLAVIFGICALFFRELVLPYCLVAAGLAAWNRRWLEAAGWAAGLLGFFAYLAWHFSQVQAQLALAPGLEAGGVGLSQWLRFGGLDFVLLTTRMNSLLFSAPGWLLWLYLLATLLGLAKRGEETSQLACFSALLYLAAFAVVGRPENFYWGLMAAPLLCGGLAHAVAVIKSATVGVSLRETQSAFNASTA